MATLPCGRLSEGKISQKWRMCFSRNGCVPISSVHILVWDCICFQVWDMVTFLLINWEKQNLQYQHCLLSILGAGGRGSCWCFVSLSVCMLVRIVFSLGWKPAITSSLLITIHSHCLSVQRAVIWVVKNSTYKKEAFVLFQVQTYEGHFHLIPIKPRFIFYSCNLGFSLCSL